MTSKPVLAALSMAVSILFLMDISASAEVEPNDSLLEPQEITEGTVTGSVNEENDLDVYGMELKNDTLLFVSLEKTDNGFQDIKISVYDENRELIRYPTFSVGIPGEAERGTIAINNTVNYYFLVEGTGNYTFKTHAIHHEYSENLTEIELGETTGSVGTIRWEGVEFVDSDRYVFYTTGTPDFKLTKDDDGPGTITMSVDKGFGEIETVSVSEKGDSEKVSIGTWDLYEDYVEITIEGDGNYTLSITEADPLEDLGTALWCFIGLMVFSTVGFLGLLVLVIVVVYRATKRKEVSSEATSGDLPPSMRPPRTVQTPPPPYEQNGRP